MILHAANYFFRIHTAVNEIRVSVPIPRFPHTPDTNQTRRLTPLLIAAQPAIPDSNGNTDANTRLAHHIANHCPGAQVVKAIYRTQPVQSQCARHKLALGPILIEQHHLARNRKVLTLRQTYFVDNVTTSGHTLEAARLALGFGAGLVFADAATRRTQIQATLL